MPEGGCLCGEVRYRIASPLRWITHCHCSMCRKQHGAAFATYATIGLKHFELLDPSARLVRYRSSEQVVRSFCGRCGSSLFWERVDAPKIINVAVGTLDGDPEHTADAHIFVASKAPWWHIDDSLPQYLAEPPIPPKR